MGRNKGVCAICGRGRKLTFEHLPPRCAFNQQGGTGHTFQQWQDAGAPRSLEDLPGGYPAPEGTGYVTLCSDCNGYTGTHYVPHYCEWVQRCAGVLWRLDPLENFDAKPEVTCVEVEIANIYPLRVIKEIIAGLLALNAEGNPRFRQRHPELARFVTEKERTTLSERYRLYAVLYGGPLARFVPLSAKADQRGRWLVTSVDHWPVAHVLSIDEHVPLLPCGEITNFAESSFDRRAIWRGELLLGFGHFPFPVDFRTRGAISAATVEDTEPGRGWIGHVEDPEGYTEGEG
jgi:hypothetical protein